LGLKIQNIQHLSFYIIMNQKYLKNIFRCYKFDIDFYLNYYGEDLGHWLNIGINNGFFCCNNCLETNIKHKEFDKKLFFSLNCDFDNLKKKWYNGYQKYNLINVDNYEYIAKKIIKSFSKIVYIECSYNIDKLLMKYNMNFSITNNIYKINKKYKIAVITDDRNIFLMKIKNYYMFDWYCISVIFIKSTFINIVYSRENKYLHQTNEFIYYDYIIFVSTKYINDEFADKMIDLCSYDYNLINIVHSQFSSVEDYNLDHYNKLIEIGFVDNYLLFSNDFFIKKNNSINDELFRTWFLHSPADEISNYSHSLWKHKIFPDLIIR